MLIIKQFFIGSRGTQQKNFRPWTQLINKQNENED